MAEAAQARNRAVGKIAALDTPQVCLPEGKTPLGAIAHGETPPGAVPDAVATAQRFVSPNAVPTANPVKIGEAFDLEIAEYLSNAPGYISGTLSIMKSERGVRTAILKLGSGDGK